MEKLTKQEIEILIPLIDEMMSQYVPYAQNIVAHALRLPSDEQKQVADNLNNQIDIMESAKAKLKFQIQSYE